MMGMREKIVVALIFREVAHSIFLSCNWHSVHAFGFKMFLQNPDDSSSSRSAGLHLIHQGCNLHLLLIYDVFQNRRALLGVPQLLLGQSLVLARLHLLGGLLFLQAHDHG
ncbi:hypothetical protein GW17_00046488 [Ensete ventricosum]|nr:hypothetical protein GW17_00046488 [Ensete ventricosum]